MTSILYTVAVVVPFAECKISAVPVVEASPPKVLVEFLRFGSVLRLGG